MLRLFVLMMPVAEAKEPPIAGCAAIWVLKQQMAKEPIFGTGSSRTEELVATAIGTTSRVGLRGGFVHGKILCWGAYLTTLGDLMDSAYRASC